MILFLVYPSIKWKKKLFQDDTYNFFFLMGKIWLGFSFIQQTICYRYAQAMRWYGWGVEKLNKISHSYGHAIYTL